MAQAHSADVRETIQDTLREEETPIGFDELREKVNSELGQELTEEEFQKILMGLVDHNKVAITADWSYKEIDRNQPVVA